MKKLVSIAIAVSILVLGACNEETPKLSKEEEKAVNDLMEEQQRKQDSLEKVLMQQLDSLGLPDVGDSL